VFGIGFSELTLIVLIVIIFAGTARLPEIGRSLGEAIRELRKKNHKDLD